MPEGGRLEAPAWHTETVRTTRYRDAQTGRFLSRAEIRRRSAAPRPTVEERLAARGWTPAPDPPAAPFPLAALDPHAAAPATTSSGIKTSAGSPVPPRETFTELSEPHRTSIRLS